MFELLIVLAAGCFASVTAAIVRPYPKRNPPSADAEQRGFLPYFILGMCILMTSFLILALLPTVEVWYAPAYLVSLAVSWWLSSEVFSRTRKLPSTPTYASFVLAWSVTGAVLLAYWVFARSVATYTCENLAKRGCLPGMPPKECRRAQDVLYCIDSVVGNFP